MGWIPSEGNMIDTKQAKMNVISNTPNYSVTYDTNYGKAVLSQ